MVRWAPLRLGRMADESGRWWLLLLRLLLLDQKAVAVVRLKGQGAAAPLFEIDDDCCWRQRQTRCRCYWCCRC